MPDSAETLRLLALAEAGDAQALEELLRRHRDLLCRFVAARISPGLGARIDPSDVVQEAHLEIARRLGDFLRRRPMSFALWIRRTAHESLLRLRRQHVDAACRSVDREVVLPEASSVALARLVLTDAPSPDQVLLASERAEIVNQALAGLSKAEREVLLLRAVDGLGNQEIAQLLAIDPATASRRFGRAVLRLREQLCQAGLQE